VYIRSESSISCCCKADRQPDHQQATAGERLCLAGDRVTPIGVYAELARLHKEEGLSFRNVITFNLDEYYPMKAKAAQSYVTFMNENLFNHVDIDRTNVHIPMAL